MLAVAARDRRRAKAPPIAQMESGPSAVLTNSPAETYEELVQACQKSLAYPALVWKQRKCLLNFEAYALTKRLRGMCGKR